MNFNRKDYHETFSKLISNTEKGYARTQKTSSHTTKPIKVKLLKEFAINVIVSVWCDAADTNTIKRLA